MSEDKWIIVDHDIDSFDHDKLHITTKEDVRLSRVPIAIIDVGFGGEFDRLQRERADLIVTAVNSHKALKEALEKLVSEADRFILFSSSFDHAKEAARSALELANNPKGEE